MNAVKEENTSFSLKAIELMYEAATKMQQIINWSERTAKLHLATFNHTHTHTQKDSERPAVLLFKRFCLGSYLQPQQRDGL